MSQETLNAVVLTYRRGPGTQRNTEVVLRIPGVNSAVEASRFVGKTVKYTTQNRILQGRIVRTHGKAGSLLARFRPGLPGQALGTRATILV